MPLTMDNTKHKARNEISKMIINYIQDVSGDNGAEIGRKVGFSKSLICKVKKGDRDLTLDGLIKVAEAYNIPYPILLLEATKNEKFSQNLEPLYRASRKVLVNT